YEGRTVNDWIIPNRQIFYANVVIEGAKMLRNKEEATDLDPIEGTALFYRAWALFQLATHFTAPYSAPTSVTNPGLPLHLTSDVNERPGRGNLQQTYDQLIKDAIAAEKLLPLSVRYKTRPVKAAATALLSRVYLSMNDYAKAEQYASAALSLQNTLIDYNLFSTTSSKPFPVALPYANEEILFYSIFIGSN